MSELRNELTKKLEEIAGIEKNVLQGEHAGFTFFEYKGKGIAHFDNDNELDVKLTKRTIEQEGLTHPADSRNHPNRVKSKPHWIVLQFYNTGELEEVVRLVKLAIAQR